MGTLYQWVHGKIDFKDEKNGITAWYDIGKVKGKTQEHVYGEVLVNGDVVAKIEGNYCGYLDIDGKRYFDIREIDSIFFKYNHLPFD